MLSLEDRRKMSDEIALYKIKSGIIITPLSQSLSFHQSTRYTRLTTSNQHTFYLPFVTTNVEYESPLLRMQRQHDTTFSNLDLNKTNLSAIKRCIQNLSCIYANH